MVVLVQVAIIQAAALQQEVLVQVEVVLHMAVDRALTVAVQETVP
jgi:hypothetical protein